MASNYSFPKRINLLCAIQFSILLVSCGGGDGTLPPITVTTASETEGLNPLSVTFDVSGPSLHIDGATWVIEFDDLDETFGGETLTQRIETRGSDSLTHTFTTPGPYTVTVKVHFSDPSTGDSIFEIPITVFPDVNLVVSSFAIDDEVTPGGLETISAIIQNVGINALEGSGHIDVGYYLSTDDIITVDDILIGDTSIVIGDSFTQDDVPFGFETLSPGENYQYDHQLFVKRNIPTGRYYAAAFVDYIDEYEWYTFPRATDTKEYLFPVHVTVDEADETDNVRVLLPPGVLLPSLAVNNSVCIEDAFEPDNDFATATRIEEGLPQTHNFCFDNSDWLRFEAIQGNVYKITTFALDAETDTQLILYDRDGSSILLFHDNIGNGSTSDLGSGFPFPAASEIVWEAEVTGTYFIKVRTTTCDEDLDHHCDNSPDGVGLDTGYSIILQ